MRPRPTEAESSTRGAGFLLVGVAARRVRALELGADVLSEATAHDWAVGDYPSWHGRHFAFTLRCLRRQLAMLQEMHEFSNSTTVVGRRIFAVCFRWERRRRNRFASNTSSVSLVVLIGIMSLVLRIGVLSYSFFPRRAQPPRIRTGSRLQTQIPNPSLICHAAEHDRR